DTWVPLDASFKQYAYTQGMDIQTGVPFDAQGFLDTIRQGATVIEAEGWVQNVNQTAVQTALTNYQNQVKTYVDTANPNATVGDVLGTKTIVQSESAVLAGTLPYKSVATGARYQALPDNLRWKIQFRLYTNSLNKALDVEDIAYTASFPQLASKRYTLSYDPASDQDAAYLSALAEDSATIIPAYLVNVRPVLRLHGEVVASGTPTVLGSEQIWEASISSPASAPKLAANTITAGTYVALVPYIAPIGKKSFEEIRSRTEEILSHLGTGDPTLISKDSLTGEWLAQAGLSYWAQLDLYRRTAAGVFLTVSDTLPSLGAFSWEAEVTTAFGISTRITAGGFQTDIDILNYQVVHRSGDPERSRSFLLALGPLASKLEGTNWDFLLRGALATGRGVSAAHVLERAASQSVRIYRIDSSTAASAIPQLHLSPEVRTEIAAAAAAGLVAYVPQTEVDLDGWRGAGYIITDPATGSGMYRISGGANGGYYLCDCFGIPPSVEFTLSMILAVIGEVAKRFAVPALIAQAILIANGACSAIAEIDKAECVSEEQKDVLKLGIYAITFISLATTALAVGNPALFLVGVIVNLVTISAQNILTTFAIDLAQLRGPCAQQPPVIGRSPRESIVAER
ncbi:MAG: DUF2179 domain-containing protein, partial [Burkholderiales bacterium]